MERLSMRSCLAFMICVIGISLFGFIAGMIGSGSIERFDLAIIGTIQGMESPSLTVIMKIFTWIGSWYVVAPVTLIASILLFFVWRRKGQAFLFTAAIGGTVLLNELLKFYFKRERPEIYRILDANGFSFPSGHTMMAFSLYTIIAYVAWRNMKSTLSHVFLLLFTMFMIFMIAISRIYLGVHFPSDIVGGFAASAVWISIVITVYEIYNNRRQAL